jgi:hypothetical protein
MPTCLGDRACVLPPDASGYCRHHAQMLGDARHFESSGHRASVETETTQAQQTRRARQHAREQGARQRIAHEFD